MRTLAGVRARLSPASSWPCTGGSPARCTAATRAAARAGTEPEEVVPYRPGEDDVRRIDWNVTARTNEPHVWRTRAEHELDTWVLSTRPPAWTSAPSRWRRASSPPGHRRRRPAQRRPRQPAGRAAPGRRRAGLVAAAPAAPRPPPRDVHAGRTRAAPRRRPHPERSLAEALSRWTHATAAGDEGGGLRLRRSRRRRRAPVRLGAATASAAARHDVVVVEVVDPRELALPDVAPSSWSTPRPAAAARSGRRAGSATSTPRSPPTTARAVPTRPRLRCRPPRPATDRDWVDDLARFVRGRRRTRVPGEGPR